MSGAPDGGAAVALRLPQLVPEAAPRHRERAVLHAVARADHLPPALNKNQSSTSSGQVGIIGESWWDPGPGSEVTRTCRR
jgi:hypothetical protein